MLAAWLGWELSKLVISGNERVMYGMSNVRQEHRDEGEEVSKGHFGSYPMAGQYSEVISWLFACIFFLFQLGRSRKISFNL